MQQLDWLFEGPQKIGRCSVIIFRPMELEICPNPLEKGMSSRLNFKHFGTWVWLFLVLPLD